MLCCAMHLSIEHNASFCPERALEAVQHQVMPFSIHSMFIWQRGPMRLIAIRVLSSTLTNTTLSSTCIPCRAVQNDGRLHTPGGRGRMCCGMSALIPCNDSEVLHHAPQECGRGPQAKQTFETPSNFIHQAQQHCSCRPAGFRAHTEGADWCVGPLPLVACPRTPFPMISSPLIQHNCVFICSTSSTVRCLLQNLRMLQCVLCK